MVLERLHRRRRVPMPGGMRRLTFALASAWTTPAEPATRGQSMPSTVSDGPRPEHVRDRPVAHELDAVANVGVAGGTAPRRTGRRASVWPLSRPWMVTLPCSSCSESRILISAIERVGRGSAEHARVHRRVQGLHGDDDVAEPSQRRGQRRLSRPRSCRCRRPGWCPPAAAPGSRATNSSSSSRPCSSEPSEISFSPTG